MNQEELKQILPHRDAMLLVDETELIGNEAHGKYHFRGDEWFFKGHFPGNPICPGVILCEILAQSAVVLLKQEASKDALYLFAGLEKVRFRESVRPGDVIETNCIITKSKPPFYFAKGQGYVNGKLCISAEFSFAMKKE